MKIVSSRSATARKNRIVTAFKHFLHACDLINLTSYTKLCGKMCGKCLKAVTILYFCGLGWMESFFVEIRVLQTIEPCADNVWTAAARRVILVDGGGALT